MDHYTLYGVMFSIRHISIIITLLLSIYGVIISIYALSTKKWIDDNNVIHTERGVDYYLRSNDCCEMPNFRYQCSNGTIIGLCDYSRDTSIMDGLNGVYLSSSIITMLFIPFMILLYRKVKRDDDHGDGIIIYPLLRTMLFIAFSCVILACSITLKSNMNDVMYDGDSIRL